MRRLRTLTVTMILGAVGGASTEGAAPDDAAISPSTTTARKPAPAPPIKYLEAGSRLFNSGQFDLAAKYLDAARMYRDQLEPEHQKLLDDYDRELKRVKGAAAAATPAVAATEGGSPAVVTASPSSPPAASRTGTARGDEPDLKQKGRWLLQESGELIIKGEYDAAEAKIAEAEALDVKWGLFDSTPAKARQALAKARPKAAPAAAGKPTQVADHKAAKSKLAEARSALSNRQFEVAEAIALEVKGWGLSYGMFEDNPDKVASAARALRKRDAIRGADPKSQPSPGVYDVLVQESRQLVKAGKLAEAEAKARQAQRMNVVPALTADRAEAVLHEIAMMQEAKAAPAVESAAVAVEREADALLAKNDQAAAAAKFAEAERLRSAEAGLPTPTLDPAVVKSGADEPDLDAPAPAAGDDLAAAPAPAPAQAGDDLAESPAPAPAAELELDPMPAPAGPGGAAIGQAQALYAEGNYDAARQAAEKAKAEGAGPAAEELTAQIDLAEQGGALSLYEAALGAMRQGDKDRARTLLTEVASAGPVLDENHQAKVQELLKSLTTDQIGDPAGRAVVNDRMASADDADSIAAQKLNAEVGAKIAEARRLQEVDPEKALAIYETTLKAVKASEVAPNLQKPMVRRLEVAVELAKKDKLLFDEKMKEKGYKEEIERKRLRILEADSAKKGRYKELMDKAQAAYADAEFPKAEQYAKQAMEVDPTEVAAPMLVFKAKAEGRYKTDLKNKSDKEAGFVAAMQGVDAAAVIDSEVAARDIKFPTSFKELTNSRREMVRRLEPQKGAKTLAVEAKLREPISVNFDKQPLSEAMAFIGNYTGVNVTLDPKALGDEGLTSSTPVSLNLQNVSLKTVLKLMLSPLGLSYTIEEEVLVVTNKQATSQDTFFHTYYVGDLIKAKGGDPSKSNHSSMKGVPSTPLDSHGQPMLGAAADAGGGLKVTKEDKAEITNEDMAPLIQLITSSIAPGTWQVRDGDGQDVSPAYGLGGAFGGGAGGDIDEGRPPGSITPFFLSISLIIRHTAEVHEQIADLLRQLRRLQDLQVSIEVRFITVTDSFFEQIGVDFDFAINSKSVGKQSTWAYPNNPVTGVSTAPGGGGTTTTGGTTGGGGIGGTTGGGTTGGTTGGGTTGGLGGGGSTGGLGGAGSGIGGGGIGGGGLTTAGGTGGTTGGGGSASPAYLINPIRDYSNYLPNGGGQPVVVGTQGGGLYNFSPTLQIPFTNTTGSLIAPFNAVTGAGASLGLAFLSDLEVYFFLTAAQGDTRNNILQAPKITTFNGASATIFNGDLQYYIASLIPIIGPGSVAFQPVPAPLSNGVTLQVTPVVTADRRYVRLSLSPFFQVINGFTSIQVPAGVGGAGLGGASAAINGTIQLPNTTNTMVSTTVTVPDGGTVLLGGVKQLQEQRLEYGVPVLSKTPWIDRLFRNVGIGRTTSSLMLMVTPRIIILEEEEERLGIPSVAF